MQPGRCGRVADSQPLQRAGGMDRGASDSGTPGARPCGPTRAHFPNRGHRTMLARWCFRRSWPEGVVAQAAKRAWTETRPRASYGRTIGWADAGADSLDTLHLTLRLEAYLDRKVAFGPIAPGMTVSSLARRLLDEPAAHNE